MIVGNNEMKKWLQKIIEPIILDILEKYKYFDLIGDFYNLKNHKDDDCNWNDLYKYYRKYHKSK